MRPRRSQKPISRDRFKEEVCEWAGKTGFKPKQIHVQSMKRKWASCSKGGRVSFGSALLEQKKPVRDVIIVHELIHLRVPNHGKLFKSLMHAFLPGWENVVRGLEGGF